MRKKWNKPYWLEGQFWWLGGIFLSVVALLDWWLAARYLAPICSPRDSLEVTGWMGPLAIIAYTDGFFGMILGYACERILDESREKPALSRYYCLLFGFVGVLLFGILTWYAFGVSPLHPMVFAFGAVLMWMVCLGFVGILLRDEVEEPR